jgi:tetratricopeptide (TPR) repeat protein
VYYKKDDLEKAKDYYERALEIRKEQLGPNHVHVAVSYFRLGHVYCKKDDLEKAGITMNEHWKLKKNN